ncbi:hypothetical protein [Hymenobacter jeollabukensis]|uniref:Uncharacterized protein n=1 Tax=Hymenobacter jeollabukensis TaxID=2025313 RepID=A0A5R8WML5_9BACT|nr:hypothetical protein [Hymenobacter jeollabukensis]TLM90607.1 hypothetical protein FDY95_18035 [Hymenobacter jeollabukensis]
MNQETVRYLINYYPQLMTAAERRLQTHVVSTQKLAAVARPESRPRFRQWMEERDLLVHDEALLSRLANGPDAFFQATAERIYREHGGELLLNNCPHCGRMARTPQARQCRHCGHNWH